MRIIVTAAGKGGVGKSLITVHLSVAAARKQRVGFVDLDPQQSVAKWFGRRQRGGIEHIAATARELLSGRAALEAAGFDLVFVDTPPYRPDPMDPESSKHNVARIEAALTAADFVIIPARPGAFDFEALGVTLEAVQRIGKPYGFVLNLTKPDTALSKAARLELPEHGDVLAEVRDREPFATSLVSGVAVTEARPGSDAAKEIEKLWTAVQERING